MRTTLKQQALAIKKAMKARQEKLPKSYARSKKFFDDFVMYDKQWIALNDAYSTLISLSLNETVIKNFEKPIGKPKVKR